jgi:hypothetical protein
MFATGLVCIRCDARYALSHGLRDARAVGSWLGEPAPIIPTLEAMRRAVLD